MDVWHGENFDKYKFKELVYWVLANKCVDLDSFRLCCYYYYNMSTIGRWIHMAVMRNIKQLNLYFIPKEMPQAIELPHCLVTCGSLEVLMLKISALDLKTWSKFAQVHGVSST